MAYKLAIKDVIGLNVEGKTVDENGAPKPFKFVLECTRLSAQEMKDAVSDKDETAFAFFEKYARDWRSQHLVLDDDDKPAAFSLEALRVLLSISGMAALCWHSYVQQVQATAKN